MKSNLAFCAHVAPALLATAVVLVAGCDSKNAELAAQREKELAEVRAELEQVKASSSSKDDELVQLRKEHLELLKLRNAVRQLGDDKKQLSQQAQAAQVKAEQAQAQVQVVQSQAQQAAQALAAQQQALAARAVVAQNSAQTQANTCINNLRMLDGAKQQWALENKKDVNAIPTAADIALYLKNGIPKCPAGGTYTLSSVGAVPVCNIPGHVLPPQTLR